MNRIALYSLLMVAATMWVGCRQPTNSEAIAAEAKQAKDAKPAVPVTVSSVAVQPSKRLVNFVGTLYGNQEVTLSSRVEGQINSLSADLGDSVTAGQIVAEIDDDQLRARLRETEAMVSKAQADEARGRQLVDSRVISPQEYETMKTHAAVAESQRDTLRVTIRHARVASPITGAVARRFVSAGEYVRPGSQLFTLVAEDPLKLRGDVPERFAHELQVGQPVHVRVDAFPDTTFTGRLSRISPASNPENRSVAIEATVDNHDHRLRPGFFANAGVVTRADDRALMVPQEALITFAGVTKLFVVANGTAQERQVHTGTRGGAGFVEITEGLEPNELVATSGLSKLENGVAVTVKQSPASEQGRAS